MDCFASLAMTAVITMTALALAMRATRIDAGGGCKGDIKILSVIIYFHSFKPDSSKKPKHQYESGTAKAKE